MSNQKPPRDPRREGAFEPPPGPKLGSIVAGKVQAPVPAVPPPVPVHRARSGGTRVGLAPPAPGSAPAPLQRHAPSLRDLPPETRSLTPPELPATLPTLKGMGPAQSLSTPPTSEEVPVPWDESQERGTYRREVEKRGGRIVHPPVESTPLPKASRAPNSLMAAAERIPLWRGVVLLTALFGGATTLVATVGNEAVKIIAASRPASNVELAEQLKGLRRDVDSLLKTREDGHETKARTEADERHDKAIEALQGKLRRIAPLVIKGDPAAVPTQPKP